MNINQDLLFSPTPATAADQGWSLPRIIFADDAVAARVLMSALLRRMNLRVDVAENGSEVLILLRQRRYDAVLLDIDMPVMDGLATAQRIRRMDGDGRRTPIIAVSGFLAEASVLREKGGDFDGVVPKPVTLASLWAALGRVLPEGHGCIDRTSLVRAQRQEVPLLDRDAGAAGGDRANQVSFDLDAAVSELRRLAALLQHAETEAAGRENVRHAAYRLDRLSQVVGAPRLQRRAAALAAVAPQARHEELKVRAGDAVTCIIATIGELKKLGGAAA